MKPGETDTERKAVYFTVYDSDGLLASGNANEGAVCAPSGSELQWKRATGTAYANSTGTFAHVGDGLYRYVPADAECAVAEGEAIAVLKLKKSGFSTQFVPVPILYNSPDTIQAAAVTSIQSGLATAATQTTLASAIAALPSASAVATAVLAATIHTGWSVARALRIIAGGVAGKATGSTFRFVDDSGDAITGTSDEDGNRTAATYGA